ncbi:MAG: TolC family outer membrane protein [Magnetococcales bacterium]|nr:TolC family outer membrane protein [Magnetococcales bacterium]
MLIKSIKYFFVLLLLVCPEIGWTGNNVHQPFFIALQKALAKNPSIISAENQVQAQREKLNLTSLELLPDLSVSLQSEYNKTAWDGGQDSSNPFSFSLSLSQPIIDFNKWKTLESAPLSVKRAEMSLLISAEKIFFQVVEETINILQARSVLERTENNLKAAKKHLYATNLRFSAGELTQTDISQAESRIASIQAELISTQNSLSMAEARFEELVGEPVPYQLSIPPIHPSSIKKLERDPVQNVNLRPDVVVALIKLEEANRNIEIQQTGMMPTLTFNTSATRKWKTGSSSKPGANDDVSFSFDLSIPIDARGKYSGKGRQAVWERDEKRADLEVARYQAVREVKHALLGLGSARAKFSALQKVELSAKTAMNGVEKEFAVGTRSGPDLLDAQNDLFDARKNLVKSHYTLILEQYKLLKAKGHLTLSKAYFDLNSNSALNFDSADIVAQNEPEEIPRREFDQMLELDMEPEPADDSSTNNYEENDLDIKQKPQPSKTIAKATDERDKVEPQKPGSLYLQSGVKSIPAGESGYVVRLASYHASKAQGVDQVVEQLIGQLFPVIKTAESIDGENYIHIGTGPFAFREEADVVRKILISLYPAQPIITAWDPKTIPGLQASRRLEKPIEVAKVDTIQPAIDEKESKTVNSGKASSIKLVKQAVQKIESSNLMVKPVNYKKRIIMTQSGVQIGVGRKPDKKVVKVQ